ncbi:MAG: diguanylate cyclase domain-containing protein, partial [Oceanobacter sp.]
MSDTSSDTSGSPPEDLNAAQIALRRLERERKARKEAERLLMVKSAELFTAKEASEKAQQQLALALWASRESVWRWCESEQSFEMQYFPERAPNGKLFKGNTGEVIDRIHPDDQELVRINWHLLLSGNITSIDLVFRSRFPGMMLNKPSESGTQNRNPWRWYHCRGQIVDQDKTGLANQAMGTIKDITQQRQTEDSLRIMAKAFASSQEAMLVVSSSGKVIEANDAFLKITRLDEHELDHYQLHQFLDLKPDEALLANQEAANNFEAQLTSPCCPSIPVEVSITRFQGKNSHQPNLIVTMRDISERKQAEHALQHMARHDALTNLPNRGSFTETLTPQLRELTEGDKIGLMFIDLDGFQAVNDEFGHIAADAALVTIARRLTASVPESALVSRWGGDEFVITFLLNDGQSAGLPARVLDSIQQPMPVAESNVRISASIGVAFYSTDQQEVDVTELIRRADSAMYQAKRSGKNQIRYYSDKQDAHNSRRVSLVSALVSALEHDEMDFYVQPKYNQKREIVGGEMLARWISP